MKAVRPRIERLYAGEIERWKAAWKAFDKTLWSHMTYDEQRAYSELQRVADDRDETLWEAVCDVGEAWHTEWRAQFPGDWKDRKEESEHADVFFDTFWQAVPDYQKEVDLSRWPAGVPCPEDDDPDQARKEEDALLKICRRDKGNGEAERLAASFLIWQVAICRTARSYSSEGSKG